MTNTLHNQTERTFQSQFIRLVFTKTLFYTSPLRSRYKNKINNKVRIDKLIHRFHSTMPYINYHKY